MLNSILNKIFRGAPASPGQKTITQIQKKAMDGEKLVMLTAYDCATAKILNEAGVDIILVGDSLGVVKLGYENTLSVTVEDIIYHCQSVKRGNTGALLVADMPFMSYETGVKDAVKNAGRIIKEGMAQAVKIEGGEECIDIIKAIIKAKIPVMGHVGLTPQAVNITGGYKVQGRSAEDAYTIENSAAELQKAGVFALVLECVPENLAREISDALTIPTIGIGAGPHCDGQVLVTDDMLGLFSEFRPKFVKRYAELRKTMVQAVKLYKQEVKEGKYPSKEYFYE